MGTFSGNSIWGSKETNKSLTFYFHTTGWTKIEIFYCFSSRLEKSA